MINPTIFTSSLLFAGLVLAITANNLLQSTEAAQFVPLPESIQSAGRQPVAMASNAPLTKQDKQEMDGKVMALDIQPNLVIPADQEIDPNQPPKKVDIQLELDIEKKGDRRAAIKEVNVTDVPTTSSTAAPTTKVPIITTTPKNGAMTTSCTLASIIGLTALGIMFANRRTIF